MKKIIITLALLLAYSNLAYSVSAYPYSINIIQPDGSTLKVLLRGDESFAYTISVDGYLITRNEKGFFEYANINTENKIIPLGVRVHNVKERLPKEIQFIQSISLTETIKKLTNNIKNNNHERLKTRSSTSANAKNITGSRRLLCILIGFSDVRFSKTQNEFDNFMNQVGYNQGNAIGSVKDYYLENSYSKLDLNITVVGPYIADHPMAYYGENVSGVQGNDARPRDLIREALAKADPYVNYADFDNDNNGSVDGVHIIYAGYSEAAGGNPETIWSHRWTLSGVSYDGKTISDYSCSAELRNNWGTQIDGIGTACHEIGHILGAPDFYDTNGGAGGWFAGTGQWDLMDGGNWNCDGDCPAHHNPYTKSYIFGWSGINTLPADNTLITLKPSCKNNDSFYKINTPTENEYFIVENRQNISFDSGLPGHGMLVYHVHSQFDPRSQENNITHPQRFYPICASATQNPNNTPSSYGIINSSGCPFPGTANRISLTANTLPGLVSWSGASTGKDIQFVQETGNNITFVVNPQISGPSTICDQATYTIENLPPGATVQWSASNSNLTLVSGQGTGTAMFRKTDDISTIGTIRANITINPATPPIVLKKEIWVNDKLLVNGEDIILKSRFNNPIPGNGSYYSPYQISSNTVYTLIFPFISQDYTVEKVTISEGLPIFFLDLDFPIVSKSVNSEDYSVDIYYFGRCSKQQHTIYFRMNNVNLLSNLSLFPNPATTTVSINLEEEKNEITTKTIQTINNTQTGNYQIQLWNSFGMVKQVTTDQKNYQLDLHGIPKGFYYIHVIKDGKTHRKQLIVK